MTDVFSTILSDIFEHGAEARLSREEEREHIAAAQQGAEPETLALLLAYAPVLRNLVGKHGSRVGVEDARSAAVSGLLEAIHAFDLDQYEGQLAGIAHDYVSNSLRDTDDRSSTISVNPRSKRRYLGILKAADGDPVAGADIAPGYGMDRMTFLAIREALSASDLDGQPSHKVERATPVWAEDRGDAFGDADDALLAGIARRSVSGLRREVVELAYGFETGDPLSNGEIAQTLSVRELGAEAVEAGQSVASTSKIQREHQKALSTMREAIGVA